MPCRNAAASLIHPSHYTTTTIIIIIISSSSSTYAWFTRYHRWTMTRSDLAHQDNENMSLSSVNDISPAGD